MAIDPSFKTPSSTWKMPATITANKKTSNPPSEIMDAATIVVNPAAGPETANGDLLIIETTIPPMIPDKIPEYKGAPEAKAIPRQSGRATKKTERPAGRSYLIQSRR